MAARPSRRLHPRSPRNRRYNFRAPKNFVGHPIPNSRKSALHQERGFDRRLPMSIQEAVHEFLIEFPRIDLGRFGFPPIGFVAAVMKSDAAELAVITEDE